MPARRIIEKLDAHIGSQFEPVRIADVTTETARVISEDAGLPSPASGSSSRRADATCTASSSPTSWAGPGGSPGPSTVRLRDDGYWPEDLIGKAGLEATYEDVLRGQYGLEEVAVRPATATSCTHPGHRGAARW